MSSVGIAEPASTREAGVEHRVGHHLAPIGAGVDVAVVTGLVAALADVDLQNLDARGRKRRGAIGGHRLLERPRQRQPGEQHALLRRVGAEVTAR